MSLEMKLVVNHTPELEKLLKKHTTFVDIYAKSSYDGVLIYCEDEAEFDKIDSDQDYAEKKHYQATFGF